MNTRDLNTPETKRTLYRRSPGKRLLRPLTVIALIASLLGFTSSFASAQIAPDFVDHCWFVADGSNGSAADWLSNYDLVTDTETPAPAGTGTNTLEAIAYHYPSGTLFATDAGQFGSLDIASGLFTPIGPGGLGDVDGLSFDSTTGNLWGTVRSGGVPDQLIRIDFNTGAQVGASVPIDPTIYSGPLNANGSDTLFDIDDLAIDPTTGTFFAIANGAGLLDQLVTLDPATGATTSVGSPADSGVQDIEGLGFTPDGALIGTTGNGGGTVANSIVDIDSATGVATPRNTSLTYNDQESVDCLTTGFFDPSIDLEKATNGQDADTPTGPFIDTAAGRSPGHTRSPTPAICHCSTFPSPMTSRARSPVPSHNRCSLTKAQRAHSPQQR